METLVKGEEVQGKKIRFLRKIPVDPHAEWYTSECRCVVRAELMRSLFYRLSISHAHSLLSAG
jgi:hypothetical protein